ncbi:MAG: STAS domain-containing protein [Chloroflexota bacterium]
MNFQIEKNGDVSVLILSGRFDAYAVSEIRAWLSEKEEESKVVVHLGNVNFVDSTALSTLVQGMKWTRQRGGDLHLANLQQPVHIIFELTRLDKAFKIFADVDEAIGAFITAEPA